MVSQTVNSARSYQAASPVVDLLQFTPVRRLVLSRAFPYAFQAVLLVLFICLAILGWRQFPPEDVPGKLFAKTNLVTLIIWGLWWPAMVWTAVLFSRAWCAVCPLELVSSVAERLARRLGIGQRKLSRWLRAGGLIVAFYFILQFLVAGFDLNRNPGGTSIFLWTMLGLAAVTALIWSDRAFCRAFCPVGLLLGTYGRGGMLAVRSGDADTCAACRSKDCVHPAKRHAADARSCPSLLNPEKLDDNADCLLCGQCFKACGPGNLRLLLRRPFSRADRYESMASWPVTLFVMIVSGFVTYELCSEWAAASKAFAFVPERITAALGDPALGGWVMGIWRLIGFPLAFWLLLGGIGVICGAERNLGLAWRRLALPVVVIVAAGHMAKGLAKMASWGQFVPGALADFAGVETATAISGGRVATPLAFVPLQVVSIVGTALVAASVFYSLRVVRKARPEEGLGITFPVLLTGILFGSLVAGWGIG